MFPIRFYHRSMSTSFTTLCIHHHCYHEFDWKLSIHNVFPFPPLSDQCESSLFPSKVTSDCHIFKVAHRANPLCLHNAGLLLSILAAGCPLCPFFSLERGSASGWLRYEKIFENMATTNKPPTNHQQTNSLWTYDKYTSHGGRFRSWFTPRTEDPKRWSSCAPPSSNMPW